MFGSMMVLRVIPQTQTIVTLGHKLGQAIMDGTGVLAILEDKCQVVPLRMLMHAADKEMLL